MWSDVVQRDTGRGHNAKVYLQRGTKSLRQKAFGLRTVTTWNNLPEEVVNTTSVNIFKERLDKIGLGKSGKIIQLQSSINNRYKTRIQKARKTCPQNQQQYHREPSLEVKQPVRDQFNFNFNIYTFFCFIINLLSPVVKDA